MLPFTAQLDRLEDALPDLPGRIVRLQRAVASATCDQFTYATSTVADATRSLLTTALTSGRTVTGQTRAASTDVIASATRTANQVVGQAKAQGRRVSAIADREATEVVDAAIEAVDEAPRRGQRYEQWTKAELLDRAKELDVHGRYGLNKKQLIAALRQA
jgi:hypothetical protein